MSRSRVRAYQARAEAFGAETPGNVRGLGIECVPQRPLPASLGASGESLMEGKSEHQDGHPTSAVKDDKPKMKSPCRNLAGTAVAPASGGAQGSSKHGGYAFVETGFDVH
jgi:hypothetical protein